MRVHRRDATDLGRRPAGDGPAFDLALLHPPYGKLQPDAGRPGPPEPVLEVVHRCPHLGDLWLDAGLTGTDGAENGQLQSSSLESEHLAYMLARLEEGVRAQ